MPFYIVYCSRVDAKSILWASMSPSSHLPFVQCEHVKFQPKKKVKMKVCHGVVAVGTMRGRGRAPYFMRIKWKMEPIPLLSLSFLIQNRYPFIIRLTERFPVVG